MQAQTLIKDVTETKYSKWKTVNTVKKKENRKQSGQKPIDMEELNR